MRGLVENTICFLLYVVTGVAGLKLHPVGDLVTLIWLPSGIALAMLTLYGRRVLPAVALGAFFTNLVSGASIPLAFAIMTGNSLAAFSGAVFLRWARFDPSLSGLKDILHLFAVAGLSPLISATIGSLSLELAGKIDPSMFALAWRTWWMGDLLGVLMTAPLILVWAPRKRFFLEQTGRLEALALGATVAVINWFLFSGLQPLSTQNYPVSYALFIPSIWAALRFGLRGTSLVTMGTLLIAVWGNSRGFGPFIRNTAYESLLFAQMFIGVWSASSLILAAAVSERKLEKKYLLMQYRIARVFTASSKLADAAAEILRTMGESLGWGMGGLWQVSPRSHELECVGMWSAPDINGGEFASVSKKMKFARGQGLPGRVWDNGMPLWIPDVTRDPNFPRAPFAQKAMLHAAFAFPIRLKEETIGVIEFFNPEILKPDERILDTFSATGSIIGQFIAKIRAEEELAENESRFRLTFERAAVGIAHVSEEGRWIRVNRRLSEILKYPLDELLQKTFQDITHPEDLKGDVEEASRLASGEASTYSREKRYVRGDGEIIWVNLTVSAVRDSSGAFQHFISVIEDITERKNYEERLKALDRVRSEFVSMISHELRTPLSAIKEGIALTYDETEGPLNDAQKATLEVSKKNIDRLTRLVNNVLQFSRADTGKIDLAQADIAAAAGDTCELMRMAIVKKGITFECDLPTGPLLVSCDPDKIQQILINLLDNAAKHTPRGGKIRFSLTEHADHVRFVVSDTGIGISSEDLDKIFGIFERGQRSRQMGITGGVGVGLAVCKRLTEQHGGEIFAESEPGQGAKFIVTLPKEIKP